MNGTITNTTKRALIILFVVILAGAIAQVVYINSFNQQVKTVTGADDTQETYLDIHDRDDSTSRWVKRGYKLHGEIVNLLAQTVDGTLYNNSSDMVNSWQLTVFINGDCFINNAWCGTVEIHQYVGTDKEAVQTLDLRSYDIADVKLDFSYDGDLLIPLQKGDFVVYYPSEKDAEVTIPPNSELTIGMIFYYLSTLDLSGYELEFQYHRDYTYGPGFIALMVLAILWVLMLLGRIIAIISYRRAKVEMELRTSVLACMSDLYSIICLIDLEKDELTPVHVSEKSLAKMPRGSNARAKTLAIFRQDTAEPFRERVMEFIDIATLPQRLNQDSISCEYVSKAFGWSEVRFFAVERKEGKPPKRVLLTIQDINEEKRELDQFEERIIRAELENTMRNALMADIANRMKSPLEAILDLNDRILNESNKEIADDYAREIDIKGKMLEYMIDSAVDAALIAAGTMKAEVEEYSPKALVEELNGSASIMVRSKKLAFTTDVSPSIPERLMGDAPRIKRALIGVLSNVGNRMENGSVKVSLYGKEVEGNEHLLFSVHADGCQLDEGEVERFKRFLARFKESGNLNIAPAEPYDLEAIARLLASLGSELHVVNGPGEECELYFEIDQKIKE